MKKIQLTQNHVALVDDEDFEWLNKWRWYASWHPNVRSYYAVRHAKIKSGKRPTVYMTREILGLKKGDGKQADHKNHNTLDHQQHNLRICTCRQNLQNHRKRQTYGSKKGSSVYSGVSWFKRDKKWRVQIMYNGKYIHLGLFFSELDAANAYDVKAKELFGEFAHPNF